MREAVGFFFFLRKKIKRCLFDCVSAAGREPAYGIWNPCRKLSIRVSNVGSLKNARRLCPLEYLGQAIAKKLRIISFAIHQNL